MCIHPQGVIISTFSNIGYKILFWGYSSGANQIYAIFFPLVIPKSSTFCSISYRFQDTTFLRKKCRIGTFFKDVQVTKNENFLSNTFFFRLWSQNFVRFALARSVSEIRPFSAKIQNLHFFSTLHHQKGKCSIK